MVAITRRALLFVCMVAFQGIAFQAFAQEQQFERSGTKLYQTIRGKLIDQVLATPIAGATVQIPSLNRTVVSGEDGSFRLSNVPIGTHQLVVTAVGFKDAVVENIMVNSGKEVVLNVALEIDIRQEKEVEVVARSRKNRPLNDMSLVSARAFTVEETQRYAAAVNDPLRMATSFAGVVSADDGNNEIVIRGNSPAGLLWRMEGIDIPNPNHFSNAGSSGGGISILSSQLLANSDFVTGAFSAEYGNALSGVFDLRLRKGNNEKREYTAQAGLLGLNVAAEGPLMPFYKGSYLVNYRYSTLQMLSKLGLDVGGGGVTNFQDLSFNIYLPTAAAGEFTIFGFAGLSDQNDEPEMDSVKWESEGDRYGGVFKSNTAAGGITHTINIGDRSQLRSAASFSFTENAYDERYALDAQTSLNSYEASYKNRKWIVSSSLNHRVSRKTVARTGLIVSKLNYSYFNKSWENPGEPVRERINSSDHTSTLQAFAQLNSRISEKLTLQGGMHFIHLSLNNKSSVEPRASIKYQASRKDVISLGYGLHSQLQAMGVYFSKPEVAGTNEYPNRNLDFTKAHHLVLSYGHSFSNTLKAKAELYYQHLFNVPVSIDPELTFSTLNIRGDYVTDALNNDGKGRNYGIDLSIEKNLQNHFYFLFNQSVYESKYTARDGIERNTRFNGNYVTNLTSGKEFILNDGKRSVGVNVKLIYAGGFRTTPIDEMASRDKGYTVFVEKEAFTLQNPAYFRSDLRLSMKWNRKKHTSTLSLDVQNLTNRQNIYGQYFDARKNKVVTSYQTSLIPILNYKVDF
jgi:hypothetical protein